MTGVSTRIGLVQMRSGTNERENIAAMREQVREAAGLGATYVQTPEMTGSDRARARSVRPDFA